MTNAKKVSIFIAGAVTGMILVVLFFLITIDCDLDKYDTWGAYYSTERKISDGDDSKEVREKNKLSFIRLVKEGEIIEVTWAEDQRKSVQEFLAKNAIRDLRYGLAIAGGAWPVKADGGDGGYFYKHDARIIKMFITNN